MKLSRYTLGLSCLLFSTALCAQEDTREEQDSVTQSLERIEGKVDSINETTETLKTTLYDQDLGDRSHGVEINFFRLLTWGEEGSKVLPAPTLILTKSEI